MSDFDTHLRNDARLVILKELSKQTDYRLNETILHSVLVAFAHNRTREWLRTQLNLMAELGVVKVHEFGSVYIAEITQLGLDHLERRSVVEGIDRPSPEA